MIIARVVSNAIDPKASEFISEKQLQKKFEYFWTDLSGGIYNRSDLRSCYQHSSLLPFTNSHIPPQLFL